MLNLAVFASGGGTNFQAIIDAVNSGELNANIKLLIINREDAYAKIRAIREGIPWVYLDKLKYTNSKIQTEFILKNLTDFDIEAVVLAGYLGIISEEVVNQYEKKIINIHPSLIPKYCGKGFYGLKVHEAVISNNEIETGVTVHYVDQGIDTGEIISQQKVKVKQSDTPESLAKRVLKYEHILLIDTLKQLIEEWN